MSAKYEELIAAGAPRLPEGYYYKIGTRELILGKSVYVDIKRERRGWLDKRMGRSSAWANVMWHDTRGLADLCLESHREAFPQSSAAESWLKPFIGRHP